MGLNDMNQLKVRSVLITGANGGIGKEVARQLALRPGMEKIFLACRNERKAQAAKQDLERETKKSIFEIVLMDVSDVGTVRSAIKTLPEPIDGLVMNAGGAGGKTPMALTKDGVTYLFASNVLGHAALLEGLIHSGRLTATAVYLGSEAAVGVPKLGMKRPALPTSSVQDFADVCTGRNFAGKKFNASLAYGEVKYVAALWMAATARKNPDLRLVTMSPGNTQGTEVAADMPAPVRFAAKYVAPLFGLTHSLETGSKRIVEGLTDGALKSGVFYASGENKLTGPVVDQSTIFADLGNQTFQNNADEAIHRFL